MTAPLRGIPSRTFGSMQGSGFKAPSNPAIKLGSALNNRSRLSGGGIKRDGGIKLLDITEQPLGRDNKRRKKVQNEENDKQKETDKSDTEPITPDYAAGLTSSIPPSPAPPSYAPPATPAPQPTVATETYSQMSTPVPTIQPQPPIQLQIQSKEPVIQKFVLNQSTTNSAVKMETKVVTTPMVTTIPQMTSTPQLVQQLQSSPVPAQQVIQQMTQPPQAQQITPAQPVVRRQLQLSREQMYAAQEMFNNSNKVTRPEKALILGFMAGSRENPCPQLGNVVTIKLSEKEEDVRQADQTIQRMIVETHFQMNYNTGEWKKVQKLRKLDQNVHQIQQQFQTLQQTV